MSQRQDPGEASRQGRRVLVATVTGRVGDAVQRWRVEQDPVQAVRLPPHTTLCYWVAPEIDLAALERQVRHAFDREVTVGLGGVREFDNDEHTFYVPVLETGTLDRARHRLYDGTHLALGGFDRPWTWHVTCVRDSRGRDLDLLRRAAAALVMPGPWAIDLVQLLELSGDRYEPIMSVCTRTKLIWPTV